MSTHSYVGVRDPDQPGQVRIRYVHSDGYPAGLIPAVRQIWATAARRDTRRLITLLLEHDWYYLNGETTATGRPPFAGEQPIPGVGMTLAATDFTTGQVVPPAPVTVVALTAIGGLDAQWFYLLDPAVNTIGVHIIDGTLAGIRPLAS
ncbi:hypothetical protein ADL15_22070 [Actinoplanes awajinensis subsp. mycoplanecinus]|uniref:Uncharacterized protein n=1 Tax=Actinoplanes awajinensis subsp. mycoplanecinus TaxID=135947 RepID=A0A101JR01_9ACTN|nr:hypothetical protein ADL15_22070 [Actinoplanes awajinensis subsp. mycoplanecinus]